MFIVQLKFSNNRSQAGQFMADHKLWLQRGFADGVFLLSGSLQSSQGGCVVAHQISQTDLQARINADPFVENGVVSADIIEFSPSQADERLKFLLC